MENDIGTTQTPDDNSLSNVSGERSEKPMVTGDTSDGYHTFNELYEFRLLYNAALFNEWAGQAKYSTYKSKLHSDGEVPFGGGWFIVGAQLPTGQITNHYELKDWDLFRVPTVAKGAPWDGHSAADVAKRLRGILEPDHNGEENLTQPCFPCAKIGYYHSPACQPIPQPKGSGEQPTSVEWAYPQYPRAAELLGAAYNEWSKQGRNEEQQFGALNFLTGAAIKAIETLQAEERRQAKIELLHQLIDSFEHDTGIEVYLDRLTELKGGENTSE